MALVGSISGSAGSNSVIGVTGSVIFSNNPAGSFPTSLPGTDVQFFVSGSIGGKNGATRNVAVFGGDTAVSGSLTVGTGSIVITSNDIQIGSTGHFQIGTAANRIALVGSDIKFFDGNNTGGKTLSELAAGGGSGGESVFTAANASEAYTTSSIAIGTAATADANGADVFFFVSGSTDGTKSALFGGDVVTSGSVTVRDNDSAISIGYGPSTGVGQITSLNGNLVLDSTGGSRVIVDTNLEIAGTDIYAGGGGALRNIFPDNVSPSHPIVIGGVTSRTVMSGTLQVIGNEISGSAGGNLTFGSSGDVTVAGDLKVAGDDIKSSTGATAITMTGASVQVVGDLQVTGNGIKSSTGATAITLAGTKVTTAGDLQVNSNYISGSAGLNLTLGSSGDVTVAGDLTVTGNDIKSSTGATAITLSGGNVIIPGDLTVQGTTLTVDATTIEMEDPVIGLGFTSGSVAATVGDRGFIGGLNGVNNAAFIWDQSESGFAAIRTTSGTATGSPITVTDYSTLRAGKFEIGAGSNVFLSSSDGASVNLAVATSATASFSQGGTTRIQFGDLGGSGEGEIKGMSGASLGALWLSGTSVNFGHGTGANQAVKMYSGGIEVGRFTGAANTSLTLTAQSPAAGGIGTARQLILTGSGLVLGAHTQGIEYKFVGSTRGSTTFGASTLTMGTESGILLSLSGANGVRSIHGVNGHAFRNNSADGDHLTISSLGTTTRISGSSAQSVTLGAGTGATTLTLSGSTVIANAGSGGFVFQKDGAPELHVNAVGTTTTLSGSASQNITLAAGTGPTTLLTLSGSAIDLNAGVSSGVTFKKDGVPFAVAGQTSDGITGLFPNSDSGASLGSPQRRWANVYTGDLHLRNDRGNWTIIEEEEYLSITNNLSGKRYRFVLEEL